MSAYVSDEEQLQKIKDWWKKYGTSVLAAVAVVAVVSFGIRYWHSYSANKAQKASVVYEQLLAADAAKKIDNVKLFAQHLMTEYPGSPYASFAAMSLASEAVKANDLAAAEKNLQWVIDHAKSKELRQIARVRAARVFAAENKLDEALTILKTVDDKTYEPIIGEARGDIYLAKNDRKEAVREYKEALDAASKLGVSSSVLSVKFSQLAGN